MTPYTLEPEDMPIFQGAKWEHIIEFQNPDETPLDLTGLGPFTLQLEKARGIILATATCVVDADPTTGLVTISLTAVQTALLPITRLYAGMRDAWNNPYIQGRIQVKEFTPEPAVL